MRSHPLVLALLFVLASVLLLGGRAAQARQAADPGPTTGPLQVTAAEVASGPAGLPALVLNTTVGLDPTTCAVTKAVTVPVGTLVTFCYQIENTSLYTVTRHTLRDQFAENILADFVHTLAPSASAFLTRSVLATSSLDNLATWSATQPITGYTPSGGTCGTFPDISSTGQALHLSDDGAVNLTLPFLFQLYDRYSDRLRVSNNGAAVLDDPAAGIGFTNQAFPTSALPHGLAVFWDDLDEETGEVYAGLYTFASADQAAAGGAPDVRWPPGLQPQGGMTYYVIEYKQRAHFAGSPASDTGTFALLLLAPGQGIDGYVVMCYQDTGFSNAAFNSGASATIGLNHSGSAATQFSFNTAHPELTGTYGIGYAPIGGLHQAFADSDSARVNAITTIDLPLINR